MSSNTKSNTITKKTKKLVIVIVVVVVIIVVIILLYVISKYYKERNKSNFDDAVPSTTYADAVSETYGKDGPPVMVKPQGCSATSDVVDFCKNYDNCCSSTNSNSKCFCEHPITKSCKVKFDSCMNDPTNISSNTKQQLTDKCTLDKSGCCKEYNNVSISSDNFNSPLLQNQTDNILCSLSSIKNMEQICMELCQTTPNCAAYSTTKLNCNLYNNISEYIPKTDPSTGKEIINTTVEFYVKKV